MKLSSKMFLSSGITFGVFLLFTILVMTVDVRPLGPQHTNIGFADFNTTIFKAFGGNHTAELISTILGYITILLAFSFGCVFLYQWIKRKSLKKVDPELFALLCFYVVLMIVYAIFLVIKINYNPSKLDKLEPSYPSSHTLLFCSVLFSAMFYLMYFTKNIKVVRVLQVVFGLLMVCGVVTRMLSGMHWATDIIGSIILSAALVFALFGTNFFFSERSEEKAVEEPKQMEKVENEKRS